MPSRIQIPFSFNYPSGGNLVPAANASVGVYVRNADGSQGSVAPVYQAQSGNSQYASLQTDSGGNVPGWVNEGTYKIVAAATGGFGGGTINFDALYGGGTALIASNAVDVPQLSTGVQTQLIPAGTILDHAGSAAPAGFLQCDGSVLSQTTYANLYNAIGSNWNIGSEGSGNFRLPNLIGTMTIGRGTATWGTVRTLGKYGIPSGGTYLGEETHTLLAAESGTNGSGTYAATSTAPVNSWGASARHAHTSYTPGRADFYASAGGSTYIGTATAWGAASQPFGTTTDSPDHSHYVPATTVYGAALNARNADDAHNNMPPFAVVNKIIKY